MRKPTRHDRIHNTPYNREYNQEQRRIQEEKRQERLEKEARNLINSNRILKYLNIFDD